MHPLPAAALWGAPDFTGVPETVMTFAWLASPVLGDILRSSKIPNVAKRLMGTSKSTQTNDKILSLEELEDLVSRVVSPLLQDCMKSSITIEVEQLHEFLANAPTIVGIKEQLARASEAFAKRQARATHDLLSLRRLSAAKSAASTYKVTIVKLRKQVAVCEQQLDSAVAAFEAQGRELETTKRKAEETLKELRERITKDAAKLDCRPQVQELCAVVQELRRDIHQAREGKTTSQQSRLDALVQSERGLQDELATLRLKLDDANTGKEKLRVKVDAQRSEAQKVQGQMADLKCSLSKAESQNQDLTRQLAQEKARLAHSDTAVATHTAALADAQKRVVTLEDERDKAVAATEAAAQRNEELESKLAAESVHCRIFSNLLDKRRRQAKEHEGHWLGSVSEGYRREDGLEESNARLEVELRAAHAKLAGADDDIERLNRIHRSDLEAARARLLTRDRNTRVLSIVLVYIRDEKITKLSGQVSAQNKVIRDVQQPAVHEKSHARIYSPVPLPDVPTLSVFKNARAASSAAAPKGKLMLATVSRHVADWNAGLRKQAVSPIAHLMRSKDLSPPKMLQFDSSAHQFVAGSPFASKQAVNAKLPMPTKTTLSERPSAQPQVLDNGSREGLQSESLPPRRRGSICTSGHEDNGNGSTVMQTSTRASKRLPSRSPSKKAGPSQSRDAFKFPALLGCQSSRANRNLDRATAAEHGDDSTDENSFWVSDIPSPAEDALCKNTTVGMGKENMTLGGGVFQKKEKKGKGKGREETGVYTGLMDGTTGTRQSAEALQAAFALNFESSPTSGSSSALSGHVQRRGSVADGLERGGPVGRATGR